MLPSLMVPIITIVRLAYLRSGVILSCYELDRGAAFDAMRDMVSPFSVQGRRPTRHGHPLQMTRKSSMSTAQTSTAMPTAMSMRLLNLWEESIIGSPDWQTFNSLGGVQLL
jgi:hypothetical protein